MSERISKSERLLTLLQLLRARRYPVTAKELASVLGISVRTLYRDIEALQLLGIDIEGEAGIGYVLKQGMLLPPLMFNTTEIEALVLGARWVKVHSDKLLAEAAKEALVKIAAVLPSELKKKIEDNNLLVGPSQNLSKANKQLVLLIRQAINQQYKLTVVYEDLKGNKSNRTLWPFGLGFFDHVVIVLAWCELREQIRHFRLDRLLEVEVVTTNYPKRRQQLLNEWRKQQKIESTDII